MRLIDADTLKVSITKYGEAKLKNQKRRILKEHTKEIIGDVCFGIDVAVSIDAVPVRHGKWIDMGDFEQCSVCTATRLKEMQTVYGKALWIKTNYCSYCGSRMEVEE